MRLISTLEELDRELDEAEKAAQVSDDALRSRLSDLYFSAAIPGQKSASNMLDQWNFGTMPLSLPVKARVVGG